MYIFHDCEYSLKNITRKKEDNEFIMVLGEVSHFIILIEVFL